MTPMRNELEDRRATERVALHRLRPPAPVGSAPRSAEDQPRTETPAFGGWFAHHPSLVCGLRARTEEIRDGACLRGRAWSAKTEGWESL